MDFLNELTEDQLIPGPQRPKATKANIAYKKLGELYSELCDTIEDELSKKSETNGMIPNHCFVYGIISRLEKCSDEKCYYIRIRDETMDNIRVRLVRDKREKRGPRPLENHLIRIHRVTVQVEYDHDAQAKEMVLSTTPHHNYCVFKVNESGEILRKTSAKKVTWDINDQRRLFGLQRWAKKSAAREARNKIARSKEKIGHRKSNGVARRKARPISSSEDGSTVHRQEEIEIVSGQKDGRMNRDEEMVQHREGSVTPERILPSTFFHHPHEIENQLNEKENPLNETHENEQDENRLNITGENRQDEHGDLLNQTNENRHVENEDLLNETGENREDENRINTIDENLQDENENQRNETDENRQNENRPNIADENEDLLNETDENRLNENRLSIADENEDLLNETDENQQNENRPNIADENEDLPSETDENQQNENRLTVTDENRPDENEDLLNETGENLQIENRINEINENRQNEIDENRQEEIDESRQDEIDKNRQDEIDKNRQDELELENRQNEVDENRQDEINDNLQDEIDENRQGVIDENRQDEIDENRQDEIDKNRQDELELENRQNEVDGNRQDEIDDNRQNVIDENLQDETNKNRQKEDEKAQENENRVASERGRNLASTSTGNENIESIEIEIIDLVDENGADSPRNEIVSQTNESSALEHSISFTDSVMESDSSILIGKICGLQSYYCYLKKPPEMKIYLRVSPESMPTIKPRRFFPCDEERESHTVDIRVLQTSKFHQRSMFKTALQYYDEQILVKITGIRVRGSNSKPTMVIDGGNVTITKYEIGSGNSSLETDVGVLENNHSASHQNTVANEGAQGIYDNLEEIATGSLGTNSEYYYTAPENSPEKTGEPEPKRIRLEKESSDQESEEENDITISIVPNSKEEIEMVEPRDNDSDDSEVPYYCKEPPRPKFQFSQQK